MQVSGHPFGIVYSKAVPKFQIIACTLTQAHSEYPDVVMSVLASLMHAVNFLHEYYAVLYWFVWTFLICRNN